MYSQRNSHDFAQLAQALGVHPIDAAKRVLEEARLGKKPPRWMRRAARAITRRASAP